MSRPRGPDEPEPYTGPPPTRRPEVWPPVARPVPYGGAGHGGSPYGPAPYGGPGYGVPGYGGWPPRPGTWPAVPPAWPPALPPGMRWEPPPGTPPHDEPETYLRAMRSRTWRWWRPLAGLALLSAVYVVGAVAIVLLGVLTGATPDLALLDLVDPVTLLVTNLSLIILIPVVWLAWAVAHGMATGWSSSVLARLRWRLFAPYTAMALGTLGVGIVLSVGVGALLDPQTLTGPVDDLGWLLLVVLLTTPLQSAAEEYLFRGYLSQMIAGWFRSERAGALWAAVVTAAVFSLAHLPGDPWTFLDRFVFALAASATVWLTGGLEAAIVLHAVNNVLVFILAGVLGDGVATAEVPAGAGAFFVLVTTAAMAGYVLLVRRSGGRLRPERWTAAQDLRALAGPQAGPPTGVPGGPYGAGGPGPVHPGASFGPPGPPFGPPGPPPGAAPPGAQPPPAPGPPWPSASSPTR